MAIVESLVDLDSEELVMQYFKAGNGVVRAPGGPVISARHEI